MAGGSRTTFNKRMKERARQEKQAEKAQRRAQRKQEQPQPTSESSGEIVIEHDEEGFPKPLDFHDFE